MEPEVDGEEGAMAMLTVWAPIVFLIMMSGLFSGLTLGLLSLDIKQLEIVISGGDENERKYAKRILPTRRKGNWLLCTLLLGNVAVNAELSILLADMTSGTTGLLVSTALITIFGEILPQATCSRYGLVIGYFTVPIVWVIMAAFAPIAWPISFILDIVLGAELGQIYTRDMFKQLMLQHGGEDAADFDTDEASMMCHVVELRETMVADIMTPLESVFSIEYSAKLDFELLARIMECGHSRIPVYNKDVAKCIVGLLFVKDLVRVLRGGESTAWW
jgi:metal transporter CNNM